VKIITGGDVTGKGNRIDFIYLPISKRKVNGKVVAGAYCFWLYP
jgi:hypothetical protein